MDARACVRFVTAVATALAVGIGTLAEADTDVLAPIDSGFEAGNDGWVVTGATLATANTSPAPHGGVSAARITGTGSAAIVFSSQVWRVPTVPAAHTLVLWLYDNDPRLAPMVELGFHDAGFQLIGIPNSVTPGSDQAAWRRVTIGPVTAPAGTVYAKVTVRGTPTASGATLYLDDATLVRGEPIATPTSSPTPEPTATATATATATSTATVVSTPVVQPTPVPTPAVFASLQNGDFEQSSALYGWSATGGTATQVTPGLGGSYAAMLTSGTDSTKFLQQAVTVSPQGWYVGSARMRLSGNIEAAWLRIAWYASPLAEGSQLRTVDSPLLAARDQVVEAILAPVRAPAEAQSARVRIMLRPVGTDPAYVTVDDVSFEPSAAPAPTATPTPASTSTPVATPTPRAATPTAIATSPPALASVSTPPAASARAATAPPKASGPTGPLATTVAVGGVATNATKGTAAGASMLRITEVLPDPLEPGNDSDYEWIELANLGTEPAALAGVLLGDNQGSLVLPDMTLLPGATLVIAGMGAAVPEAFAYRPAEGFSNGLANGGDRLALFRPDRTVIDALSYGADTTYDRPPLPSPAPGSSLVRRFAEDGTYAGFEVLAKPSPGKLEPRVVSTAATAITSATSAPDWLAWGVLALIGAAALGAAGVQRYRLVRSESPASTSRSISGWR